jgi:phytoene dehydrogenase-like protein
VAVSYTSDILIIGGGIAGLTAASYLSQAGFNTLLCEKEKKTGGLVNSFEYKGFVFDGGIRSIENLGIIIPMLKQLGIKIDFLKSTVSIGIGRDVVRLTSKDSLGDYQALLNKQFPENTKDIAGIIHEVDKIMGYMDILYGIDNPLFLDLKNDSHMFLKPFSPGYLNIYLLCRR